MTPEHEDTLHEELHYKYANGTIFRVACVQCNQDWPCAWEQRRRQYEAALRVVEAARAHLDAPHEGPCSLLRAVLGDYDAYQREHGAQPAT